MLNFIIGFVGWMLIIGFILWLLGLVGFYFPLYAANPWGFLAVITFVILIITNLLGFISSNS